MTLDEMEKIESDYQEAYEKRCEVGDKLQRAYNSILGRALSRKALERLQQKFSGLHIFKNDYGTVFVSFPDHPNHPVLSVTAHIRQGERRAYYRAHVMLPSEISYDLVTSESVQSYSLEETIEAGLKHISGRLDDLVAAIDKHRAFLRDALGRAGISVS